MKKLLRTLIVEDSDSDLKLILLQLQEAGYEVVYEVVQTVEQMTLALQKNPSIDVILSDYRLPHFDAPQALSVLKLSGLDIPFIIISGTIGEERAVSTMRDGARDFISKNDLVRLAPVIERELREADLRRVKRKVEQAFKNSEQRYRMIVNTAKEGIWLFDNESKATFVNSYLAKMLGYHEQELLGHKFVEYVSETQKDEAIHYFESLKKGLVSQQDFWLCTKDMQEVAVSLSATSMIDENNDFQGCLIMVTDVTERIRIENERSRLLEDLKAAVKIRDEFLSIASHELKTPLTSLKLQTQIRQKAISHGGFVGFTNDKLKRMFDGDARHIERLTHLIDDMLDISRISAGKLAIHCEQFDICELTREVVDRLQGQFDAADCKVTVTLCPSVFGSWDRFRIEQVLVNLLTNAIKYGAGKPVDIKLEETAKYGVRVSVRDQGIGIAKESQKRIFQRFERAISANEISGLGLGLYIVQQIVEFHGGKIWVESEIGHGSIFTVELPLYCRMMN